MAKGVFDIDSVQLIQMVKILRDEKKFQSGQELKTSEPKFFIGAAENPFADPFKFRAIRLAKKITAGADFIQTQIIYNVPKFKEWMKMVTDMGLHEKAFILAGVAPLKSAGMAKHMKHNVPGMDVPDEVMNRMTAASAAKKERKKASRYAWRSSSRSEKSKVFPACTSWPLNGKRPFPKSSSKPNYIPDRLYNHRGYS